jgi:hypothetical protein
VVLEYRMRTSVSIRHTVGLEVCPGWQMVGGGQMPMSMASVEPHLVLVKGK